MVKKNNIRNLAHKDVPASVGLVKEIRSELRAEIRGLGEKLEKKIEGVKTEVHGLKSEIHGIKAEVQEVLKSVHHTQVIIEEQRSENRIVLDGLKNMIDRQDRIEQEMSAMRQ
jgi:cytochrome b